MARPSAPEARKTSTSTVGLPRESRTSRPTICSMLDIGRVAPVASVAEVTCVGRRGADHPTCDLRSALLLAEPVADDLGRDAQLGLGVVASGPGGVDQLEQPAPGVAHGIAVV